MFFIKNDKCVNKNESFYKNDKFVNKKGKGVISEKKKKEGKPALLTRICPPGLAVEDPDMSKVRVLVQFCMFGFKIEFLTKFLDDSAWFCLKKLKNIFFRPKTLIFDPKSPNCPYGPLWAHMGPYGSSWAGLGRSRHVRFPTFGRILHVLGSKFGF